ncbi:MAG: hypothetical protein Q4E28_01495 [Clostridia bacterium]|nr:hypothetical protein [Clostridia bacterium]
MRNNKTLKIVAVLMMIVIFTVFSFSSCSKDLPKEKNVKQTSMTKPAKNKKWFWVPKKDAKTDEVKSVPLMVTEVQSGSKAEKIIKEKMAKSIYQYSEAETGLKWVIVEYKIDLRNIATTSQGKPISVLVKAQGKKGKPLKFAGRDYVPQIFDLSDKLSSGDMGIGYVAFKAPKDSDVVLIFGDKQNYVPYGYCKL